VVISEIMEELEEMVVEFNGGVLMEKKMEMFGGVWGRGGHHRPGDRRPGRRR